MRYSKYQKWLSSNLMVGASRTGYSVFRKLFPLPSYDTITKFLEKFNSTPGIHQSSGELVYIKVNPVTEMDKWCTLLIDEMSLKVGLSFDEKSKSIIGFEDDGDNRTKKFASSVVCFMVAGMFRRWKFPLGYIFTSSVLSHTKFSDLVYAAIDVLEKSGFYVKVITTDQGPNLEKALRLMGVQRDQPFFIKGDNKYLVYRDPPHLLKSARNFIEKSDINIPNHHGKASWTHLQKLYHLDSKNSLKLAPKVTHRHLYDLRFANRMKVKLAAQILSRSVEAAINYLVAKNEMDTSSLCTSQYCFWINNIFDFMNSLSSKDNVVLRKPLNVNSQNTTAFLNDAKEWLLKLKKLNFTRPNKFIDGFIQNINVLSLLSNDISNKNYKYLSTRNLNQDCLEQFFGQIRTKSKFPTAKDFMKMFSRLAVTSLVRPPKTMNCEYEEPEDEPATFLTYVSLMIYIISSSNYININITVIFFIIIQHFC